MESLRQDNEGLTAELATATTKLGIAQGVIVALKENVASAQQEIEGLRTSLSDAQAKAASIESECIDHGGP